MLQVIFRIPISIPGVFPDGIPIYGFGLMLFLAFVICIILAGRRALKVGVSKELVQDVAIWVIVGGVLGARTTFLLVEEKVTTVGEFFSRFFRIWDGGLVYYGSVIGGAITLCLVYYFYVSKRGVGFWKLADIFAPCVALGLCIGRIGCLLNGCCYGDVACPECASVSYPLSAYPRLDYTRKGFQTAAGFTLNDDLFDKPIVGAVEPHSAAEAAGLEAGDIILKVNDQAVGRVDELDHILGDRWPRGENKLTLEVQRAGDKEPRTIGPFRPWSLGLFPTQIHESISTFLLFLLMLAFEPFKPREGALMVMFLLFYPIHRFFDEMLRNDTPPVAYGMTLSQNVSILVFISAILVLLWMWRQPAFKQVGQPV